jgi:hypothetical protein
MQQEKRTTRAYRKVEAPDGNAEDTGMRVDRDATRLQF